MLTCRTNTAPGHMRIAQGWDEKLSRATTQIGCYVPLLLIWRWPEGMVMSRSDIVAAFRTYQLADYTQVARSLDPHQCELAPSGHAALFEAYIAIAINGELKHLPEVYSKAKRSAFWVVEGAEIIIGSFGIESRSDTRTRGTSIITSW